MAALVRARRRLDLQSATLVTVPVPADAALSPTAAESAIVQATQEADAAGIHGPAATPWLLQRVLELTDGASLEANTALLRHNAGIAARIARVLSEE